MQTFKNVNEVRANLNKHYKSNALRSGSEMPRIKKVPFGEPALDYASDGGVPIGRVSEFLGDPHTGKTRNALVAMGKWQKYCFNCWTPDVLTAEWTRDKQGDPQLVNCSCSNCSEPKTTIQAMVDIEGTCDPNFMEYFGIDIDGVIYSRPDKPSQAVGIVDTLMRTNGIGLILLDSIGSMGSDKEVDTAIEDDKMNQNALFFNKAMRKWQMALNANTNSNDGQESGTAVIIINQMYTTLDFFSKQVPQGGRGLRHGKGLSLLMAIFDKNIDPKTKEIKGVHVRVKNEKNKVGIPYRRKEYYLNLDPFADVLEYCQTNVALQYIELAIDLDIIEQKGAWFYYGSEKYQGKASLIDAFNEDIKNAVDEILYKKDRDERKKELQSKTK